MLAARIGSIEKSTPDSKAGRRHPAEGAAPKVRLNPLWHSLATHIGPDASSHQVRSRSTLHSSGAQAKLTVGQPNDKYEQEADRVAERVMAMPAPGVQRQTENEEEEEVLQTKPLSDQITPMVQREGETPEEEEEEPVQAKFKEGGMIQRLCPECEKEMAQRQPMAEEEEELQAKPKSAETSAVTSGAEARINGMKGGGQPLDSATRNFFEPRFGYDFSSVRVHRSGQAADVSRSISARAFTLGNNVVFASGQYQPQSGEGKKLLGHELTHVVQQGGTRNKIQRSRHVLENDPSTAPAMSCPVANSSPVGLSLDVTFGVNSSALVSRATVAIDNFVNNWHLSGGTDPVRIDGYASADGRPGTNWPLSCARAEKMAAELIMPSSGALGIPASSVSLFAQGETERFSPGLAANRRAQAHIPYTYYNPLNLPDMRHSARRQYVYGRRDATVLYGVNRASGLVPASGFNQQSTAYTDYTKQWTNGLGIAQLNLLGGDCGRYARELVSRTGRPPESYGTSRPGIGLSRASDLRPGEAYYMSPEGGGAGAIEEDILSPWNNTVTVRKHLTNFHVAAVVAKDGETVITSEVNAAFPGRVRPWFTMYRGNRGFYRTYRREYRRGGVNPGLWRM